LNIASERKLFYNSWSTKKFCWLWL